METEFEIVRKRYQDAVESYLNGCFTQDLPQKQLFEAMRYSLLAGGKRIRPILVLEFCRICGGDWEKALQYQYYCVDAGWSEKGNKESG